MRRFISFLPVLVMLSAASLVDAQTGPALAGRWEGTLVPKTSRRHSRELGSTRGVTKLPVVVVIAAADDGKLSGTWASAGRRGSISNPIGEIASEGDGIRISVPATKGSWEGTLSADGSTLEGKWTQSGATSPLVLKRVGDAAAAQQQ
jgi:hypothetical protein